MAPVTRSQRLGARSVDYVNLLSAVEDNASSSSPEPVKKTSKKTSTMTKTVSKVPSAEPSREVEVKATSTSKRKHPVPINLDDEDEDLERPPPKKPAKRRGRLTEKEKEENRLARFEKTNMDVNAYEKLRERALKQRMFVLERVRNDHGENLQETVEIAGTTGNIYKVIIKRVPHCDCPQGRFGKYCKHIVYVLARVLRAPLELQGQLDFSRADLEIIFDGAPPIAVDLDSMEPHDEVEPAQEDKRRKPIEEDSDCAICYSEMEKKESLVWCKAACGNNFHKACFEQWAATKRLNRGVVTCPMCRSAWQEDGPPQATVASKPVTSKHAAGAVRDRNGYYNIADQLGISSKRDASIYRLQSRGELPHD